MLRSVTATPGLVIGFHESAIQAYMLVVYISSTFIHSNVGDHFGFLEKILVFPRFHHWHHGVDKEAIDVNFAIHFPFLDRLFGTHHLPKDQWPSGYGIAGHPVQLIVADDGGDPAKHRSLVQQFVEQRGVVAFLHTTAALSGQSAVTYLEGYLFIALVYWVLCFGLSRYSIWLERRLAAGRD